MKVTVAIDSLKGSLCSMEAGEAIRLGILLADKSAEVRVCPIADGGEGTVEALTSGLGGRMEQVSVTGPLGAKITARYGILPEDSGFNGNSLSEDERTDLSRLSDTGGKTSSGIRIWSSQEKGGWIPRRQWEKLQLAWQRSRRSITFR